VGRLTTSFDRRLVRWLETAGRRYVVSAAPESDAFGEYGAMRVRVGRRERENG
jgi:hypothetical protein